ncbi:Gamma-aminobutyric acid receptor subunit beta [Aphelenchoides fujianensis]|nr:Gamma-aminobutyric acid receptor subunit beta [Aphelenchoides fujianensis]
MVEFVGFPLGHLRLRLCGFFHSVRLSLVIADGNHDFALRFAAALHRMHRGEMLAASRFNARLVFCFHQFALLFALPFNPLKTVYDTKLENNVSKILDALIASHDRRIRPNYGAISEVSMDFTIDFYLRQFWRDTRLAFNNFGNDKTTSPHCGHRNGQEGKLSWFFPNEKKSFFHDTTSHNSFLRIDSRGNVIRSIRLTVTANCPMALQSFPVDTQLCSLEIESYGYSDADIIYHWHHINPVVLDENVHLAHFTIVDHTHVERTISLSTEATQARVAIGVTTVLTQTTLMTSTNASLPKVSYIKSLDIFLGVCFIMVFASLLEYAAVGYLMKRQRGMPMGKNSAQMVYYYEYEDHPQVRMNSVHSNKRRSVRRSNAGSQVLQNGIEQAMPLLSVSPTTSGGLAPTSARLSIAGPMPMLAGHQHCDVVLSNTSSSSGSHQPSRFPVVLRLSLTSSTGPFI